MKKIFLLLLTAVFAVAALHGQDNTAKGIVVDENGTPMIGVSVILKGTYTGTITNDDGTFSIQGINDNDVLVFSYIGYNTQEIRVGSIRDFNIALIPDIIGMEEVVVTGYGTQRKVNLTGSVITLDGDDLADRPVLQTSMALQGAAPGVTVTQRSGRPGGDGGTIRIRGIGTLGDSDPLVLIDGTEGNINGVDPNEIESISVLKDAASAAIYGSRAANGVILISTKRAKEGGLKIQYNGYAGWQEFTDLPEYVDGYTYMVKQNEALENVLKTPIWSEEYLSEYQEKRSLYSGEYPDVDFQKLFFTGSGLQQHHNLNVSGGNQMLKTLASFGYMNQEGLIPNFNYQRYSVRMNNDLKVSDKIQVKVDMYARISPAEQPQKGESATIRGVQRFPSILAVYLPDGKYSTNLMGYGNPYATLMESGLSRSTYTKLRGLAKVNIQPIEGMDLELMYSPEFNESYNNTFAKPVPMYIEETTEPVQYTPSISKLDERVSRTVINNLHALMSYSRSFGMHKIDVLTGYEQIDYYNHWLSAYRENFIFPTYPVMNNGSVINMNNGGNAAEWALQSVFGRLNYNLNERYLFEANVRYDGSSRFAEGHKYGLFPSFSAGWRVSEEAFMENISWMNYFKLRASWGMLGNQNIGNYPFASVLNLGLDYILNGVPVPGAALTAMANELISWESSTSSNIGVDLGLFNKVSATFEYYIRNTNDILLRLPIPETIGLSAPYQNAGAVRNAGWDFSIEYHNRDNIFKYDVSFHLSDVKNEVVDLKETGPYISGFRITEEGTAISSLYMYESNGIFQSREEIDSHATQFGTVAPGDIRYVDQLTVDTDDDGVPDEVDGVINADDRIVAGSTIPRYSFGLNLGAAYKGIDISAFLQGVGKRDAYLSGNNGWPFFAFGNIQEYQLDSWSEGNTDAAFPRLVEGTSHNNFEHSDFYIYNGAYARLKTLQVGYSIPVKIINPIGIDKLRVYVAGNNLYTFTKLPNGWDPEQPAGDVHYYPITKNFVFGLNITF